MTRALMIQGCGSSVGKSLLVAGLVRAAHKRGISVAPFKPQNMSNNSSITVDGGEVGRAQAFQAFAAGIELHSDMNPILLKPENIQGSQVILLGRKYKSLKAREYFSYKRKFLKVALQSFKNLAEKHELIVVEGAGSAAEVNLRKNDIANMGFATAANIPVVIIGDIDRGGVIAQLVGTKEILEKKDVEYIQGFLINKFKGDKTLFDDGVNFIEENTGWKSFGVLPFFNKANLFPAEDSHDLRGNHGIGPFKLSILKLPRISNFDDFDPLRLDERLSVRFIEPNQVIPSDTNLVIIPGTKSTISDLEFLKEQGWDVDIRAHVRRGGFVLGICGGYQMLGNKIIDNQGFDGKPSSIEGLNLLNVYTTMKKEKNLGKKVFQSSINNEKISGYEIHLGQTEGLDSKRPFAKNMNSSDGAISENGRIMGTYIHGLFFMDQFRNTFFSKLSEREIRYNLSYSQNVENVLDEFVALMEKNLDVEKILSTARKIGS
jgi:adenosylcobyric acid synthase